MNVGRHAEETVETENEGAIGQQPQRRAVSAPESVSVMAVTTRSNVTDKEKKSPDEEH